MSTFDGIVKEFPSIRIDYFRTHPNIPPPLACFLSHVHSDHLQGLESFKSPFIYCSAATKRLLLRMEKYPHRMNFAKGILETRKQHYRHLKNILKALPLETPTELELDPKLKIQVTLFDGNHCSGAVMFLIEGEGIAILYTGDVRAESWWVNSITKSPVLVPYTSGQQQLDCVYLDTTFASNEDIYQDFPTKADGLAELIGKVKAYPPITTFYFRAWTLGYESVWIALSRTLKTKVHVDNYQMRLFGSLVDDNRDGSTIPEGLSIADGAALIRFKAGNHDHSGCLTNDMALKPIIHSCEPGTVCHTELSKNRNVVWITPIISRTKDGAEIREIGAGGGGGDLYQTPELEVTDMMVIQKFAQMCKDFIKDPELLAKTINVLSATKENRDAKLSLEGLGLDLDAEIPLKDLILLISRQEEKTKPESARTPWISGSTDTIHFPYSRHSSYNELRHLIETFKPKDICPCTVDENSWSEEVSMQSLFGDICSEQHWHYDEVNRAAAEQRRRYLRLLGKRKRDEEEEEEEEEKEDQMETQQSVPSEDVFETAQDGEHDQARETQKLYARKKLLRETVDLIKPPVPPIRTSPRRPKVEREDEAGLPEPGHRWPLQSKGALGADDLSSSSQGQEGRIDAIKNAFRTINHGDDAIMDDNIPPDESEEISGFCADEHVKTDLELEEQARYNKEDDALVVESQDSLASTAFQSQPRPQYALKEEGLGMGLDGAESTIRIRARQEAYRAARLCLQHSNSNGEWEELGSRAIGRKDHGEVELEL